MLTMFLLKAALCSSLYVGYWPPLAVEAAALDYHVYEPTFCETGECKLTWSVEGF